MLRKKWNEIISETTFISKENFSPHMRFLRRCLFNIFLFLFVYEERDSMEENKSLIYYLLFQSWTIDLIIIISRYLNEIIMTVIINLEEFLFKRWGTIYLFVYSVNVACYVYRRWWVRWKIFFLLISFTEFLLYQHQHRHRHHHHRR